jgi:hypothetical protein
MIVIIVKFLSFLILVLSIENVLTKTISCIVTKTNTDISFSFYCYLIAITSAILYIL